MTRRDGIQRLPSGRAATVLLAAGAAASLAVAGCGGRGLALVPVTGCVSFNGMPVESGEIVFRAADGAVASGAGPIAAGRYEVRAPAGAKRVEIIATRRAAAATKPGGSGESAPAEMYVPNRYNAKSTLTAEITAAGPNTFDFELEGARK